MAPFAIVTVADTLRGIMPDANTDDPFETLRRHVTDRGLRMTRQRMLIAEVLLAWKGHVNIDELYAAVKAKDDNVGYATIYRTVKLLQEAGLVSSHEFGHGPTRFEPAFDGEHHDHLVCTRCKRIVEFHDDEIERLQLVIAERHGFRLTEHRMELYGLCPECRARVPAP